MVTPILSDEVINSTELRNNQKRWLDRAYVNPVSIMSGNKKLVLLNREHAKHMYSLTHYAEIVLQFCRERIGGESESKVFPWTKYLNKEEAEEFSRELLTTFEKATNSREWLLFEELLEDWKATANAISNPDLTKALLAKAEPSKYVKLKE